MFTQALQHSATNNTELAFSKYTSHAQRHGSATTANGKPGITFSDVAYRGNWSLDAQHRVFIYLATTDESDAKMGRVLSGWQSNDTGALLSVQTQLKQFVDIADRNKVKRRISIAQQLSLVLLLHFEIYITNIN
jgi:hypothetical protein